MEQVITIHDMIEVSNRIMGGRKISLKRKQEKRQAGKENIVLGRDAAQA